MTELEKQISYKLEVQAREKELIKVHKKTLQRLSKAESLLREHLKKSGSFQRHQHDEGFLNNCKELNKETKEYFKTEINNL